MPLKLINVKKRNSLGEFSLPKDTRRILIVGNGMTSAKLCQELVRLNLNNKFNITVIGEEKVAAYNRIKLGEYAEHEDIDKLILEDESWYADNSINLKLGIRVNQILREQKIIQLSNGETLDYDIVVLATGSRPTLPGIEGIKNSKVFTYRNLEDLQRILTKIKNTETIAIMGGGLLGIEAAHTFQKLGISTSIIQRANFLMTKQLNTDAAQVLENQIKKQGIKIYTKVRQAQLYDLDNKLKIKLNDIESLTVNNLIVSAGITPNTEIAKEAEIECGLQGGCIIDEHLRTSDTNIFAIGECALLDGKIYGLAAPGFEMAVQLAELISGNKKRQLNKLDTSTRLKMTGIDVSVIGSSLEQGNQYIHQTNDTYRLITLDRKRKVIGAMAVGKWDDYAELHDIYLQRKKVGKNQLEHFTKNGNLFPDSDVINPRGWADSRVICNCMSVKKGTIIDAIEKHGSDPEVIASVTQASTVCGSCDYLLQGLCGKTISPLTNIRVPKSLLITSIIALSITTLAYLLPPAPIAESVTSLWAKVDRLWRDNLLKQITGYAILAIFTIGLLVSARKRLTWFKFGKYASWRYFHVAFGVLSLVMLYAHTGFHFGHNLNFWLMFVFTLLNLLGAFTGIIIALENTKHVALARLSQLARPYMLWGHIILFWPLPVLITFHILSAYQY